MKLVVYALVMAILIASAAFGQQAVTNNGVNPGGIQTGFLVVNPDAGAVQGLSGFETFGAQLGGNFVQSSVLSSPLVTLTDIVVSLDPRSGTNTGIAIVNPNDSIAAITLTIRNQQGVTIATRSITVGGRQQLSRFVTELFAGDPLVAGPLSGLLFINSTVAVSVVGLLFNGGSFTSLPVAMQLNTDIANAAAAPPLPSMLTPIPSTFANLALGQPITGIAAPLVTATGQIMPVSTPNIIGVSQVSTAIAGPGALILPQVVAGGGWVSQITIANTSAVPQAIRVDFFNSSGGPMVLPRGSGLSIVTVPAGGVVTFSTAM